MGTSLSGLTPASTFDGLLKVGDNDSLTADLKAISDGSGNDSALQLSTGELKVVGQFNVDTGTAANIINLRGSNLGINQIYQANEVTYNTIEMVNSSGIRLKNGTNTTLVARETNVGIGNGSGSPSARLHVKGSGATSATTSLLVQNSAGDDMFKTTDDGGTTLKSFGASNTLIIDTSGGVSGFQMNSSNGQQRFRIQGTSTTTRFTPNNSNDAFTFVGNGIYTSAAFDIPSARLHVKGAGNDNTTTSLLVQNSDGTELMALQDDGATRINLNNTLKLINNSGSTRVTFDGEGNLGIRQGTPTARLDIRGAGTTSATSGLLVTDSSRTDLFRVRDDGTVLVDEYIYPADGTTNSRFRVSNSSGTYMYYSTGNLRLNPSLVYTSTTYGTVFSVSSTTGDFSLNGATGAKMAIKGNGATSATTSLLVENSAGTELIKVLDDGQLAIKSNSGGVSTTSGTSIFSYTSGGGGVLDVNPSNGNSVKFRARGDNDIFLIQTNPAGDNVGIGASSPDSTAKLQVDSTTQGFLPPRMTGEQIDAIESPASGLIIYNTTTNKAVCYNGTSWNDMF
jgi:hypothetical protein